MHSILEIIHEKISKNEILMKFYKNTNKYKYNYSQLGSNETKISENIYVLRAINSIKMDIPLYSMLTTYFGVPPSAKIQQFHPIKACFFVYYLFSLSPVPLTFGHRNCCVCHVKLFIKSVSDFAGFLGKGRVF